MNRRLQEIFQKNAEFEKESPYNFCDRWCERCTYEKKAHCKVFQDEFERKITCVAHGREPDDPEMTAEVMKKQYEKLDDSLEEDAEDDEIDLDDTDGPEFERIKEHIRFVETNPLPGMAAQYYRKADAFLEYTYYKKAVIKPELAYNFETVSWYHTLLPVKLQRALAGFHEPVDEYEFALYDAVAQFEICKKAINESVQALKKISESLPYNLTDISELLAMLQDILKKIETMEDELE